MTKMPHIPESITAQSQFALEEKLSVVLGDRREMEKLRPALKYLERYLCSDYGESAYRAQQAVWETAYSVASSGETGINIFLGVLRQVIPFAIEDFLSKYVDSK